MLTHIHLLNKIQKDLLVEEKVQVVYDVSSHIDHVTWGKMVNDISVRIKSRIEEQIDGDIKNAY